MAGSINKITLVGNLGRDPEAKTTTSGKTLCRFSLATSERWTDKGNGEKQERTEWHSIKCWGGLANLCQQHLRKGAKVYVEGRLQSREDEQGRKFWDVIAGDVVFLDRPPRTQQPPAAQSSEGSWGAPQPQQPQPPQQQGAWGDWR